MDNLLILKRKIINSKNIDKNKYSTFFIKKKVITDFTHQLSTLILAGIPLVQALDIIIKKTKDKFYQKLFFDIKLNLEVGTPFSKTLQKHPQLFNAFYCALVRLAEKTGLLGEILSKIAIQRENTNIIQQKIKKALLYPIMILTTAIVVSCILLIKVIPTFKELFEQFNVELPYFTKIILNFSDFLINNGFYIFILFLSFSLTIIYFINNNLTLKTFFHKLLFKILSSGIKARFFSTLLIGYQSGLALPEALSLSSASLNNLYLKEKLNQIQSSLNQGQNLNTALEKITIFSTTDIAMINIGEQTGKLDAMLDKIATHHQNSFDDFVTHLTTLLEPTVMLLLGLITGILVIAMYLPLFNLGNII